MIYLALVLLGTGLITGFIAGMVGIGGGIVVVPVLHMVFEHLGVADTVLMPLSVGTSLGTVMITSIASARGHNRHQQVDWPIFKEMAPFIVAGVVLGSVIVKLINGHQLTVFFAGMALVLALLLAWEKLKLAKALPSAKWRRPAGLAVGTIASLMGIGSGIVVIPLATACHYPVKRAIGTAAAFGVVVSVPGIVGFMVAGHGIDTHLPLTIGYVNLPAVALIGGVTLFSAGWGAKASQKVPAHILRRMLAAFLVITAIKLLVNL
ncbi:MAG: TSUP family transporter [Proteobacteria bacterium]|nr:TSUP family transporter [Pseudomonadota bacterium]